MEKLTDRQEYILQTLKKLIAKNGYLKRTSRGRMVTDKTYDHLGIKKDSTK